MLSYLNHHDRLDLKRAERGVCAPIVKFHAFGQESPVGVASRLPHLRHRRCTDLEPVGQGCSHHIFVGLCSPSVDMRIGYRGWYFQVPGVAMKDKPTARIVGDMMVALFLTQKRHEESAQAMVCVVEHTDDAVAVLSFHHILYQMGGMRRM